MNTLQSIQDRDEMIARSRATAKAINRWLRKNKPFAGGCQFGVDYRTWAIMFPKISREFSRAMKAISGRTGDGITWMPRDIASE